MSRQTTKRRLRYVQAIITMLAIASLMMLSSCYRSGKPNNASAPMLVSASGSVTDVTPLQPENAYAPMLVSPSGSVNDVNP